MRRYELKKHLIWVNSTSYKELKEKFDVCDKVIVGDLEYIEDVEGITLERKPGVGMMMIIGRILYTLLMKLLQI